MMKFSQDWFSHNIPNFQHCMNLLPKKDSFLEIGCFEGRATVWMLENGLNADGSITCIDTFEGSEEHAKRNMDLSSMRRTFDSNVSEVLKDTQNINVIQDTSYYGLAYCIARDDKFDFIYVDGSHTAPDVMTDACMALGMLKPGGIMLFDDYLWKDMEGELHRPKIAVDLFTHLFSEQCEMVLLGYQLAVRKL
jgi:predicted O-methyltransferase YrrM